MRYAGMADLVRHLAATNSPAPALQLPSEVVHGLRRAIQAQGITLPTPATVVGRPPTNDLQALSGLQSVYESILATDMAVKQHQEAARAYMKALDGFRRPASWSEAAALAATHLLSLAGVGRSRILLAPCQDGRVVISVLPTRGGRTIEPLWAEAIAMALVTHRVRFTCSPAKPPAAPRSRRKAPAQTSDRDDTSAPRQERPT
jgi:hypothetical protein